MPEPQTRPQKRLARLQSPLSVAYRAWCRPQATPKARCATRAHGSLGSGWPWPLAGWSAYASLAWQLHQVSSLREEKAALLGEVAQLQANADDWAKRGGRAKLEKCGDAGRLCVRIDKTTGYGKDSDYFVLRGY